MTALNYAETNGYTTLAKFDSIAEFNAHFEQAMVAHKSLFTKSEYIALNKLRKFAATFVGVAWCKLQKAVASTHQDETFGVSRASFDRMLRKARKLNLITVINQERKNKWQKHNVYVFNRLEELTPEVFEIVSISNTIDVPNELKIDAPITNLLLELPRLKDLNTYPQAEIVSASNHVNKVVEMKDTPYYQIKNLVDGLVSDKNFVYKIYGVWMAQSKHAGFDVDFDVALIAAKKLAAEVKRRRNLELVSLMNPVGYFSGILSNMIAKVAEENIREMEELEWFAPVKDATSAPKKSGYVLRQAPEWFHNESEVASETGASIDYDAARREMLRELGYSDDEIK